MGGAFPSLITQRGAAPCPRAPSTHSVTQKVIACQKSQCIATCCRKCEMLSG